MPGRTISVLFNAQQLELLARSVADGIAPDLPGVIRLALHEFAGPPSKRRKSAAPQRPVPAAADTARHLRSEHIMEPGTGKAVEVRAGQVLRIEQTRGQQCVDFNCFNLHDYKEVMHVGRMRAMYGLNPGKGDFIWSAPPRERPMMFILDDTAGFNDVMFSRCNAYLYETAYGFAAHTNCHDIQAEAQREYGLTPDDVHDSFNFFMCTEVRDGRLQINRPPPRAPGHCDAVELLAVIDVLAVPNVCGNDVGRTSNFELKPIKVSVLDASAHDLQRVPKLRSYPNSQRTPERFRQPVIKRDRPLTRDPSFVPQFTNVPLRTTAVAVPLESAELDLLQQADPDNQYGGDEPAILRDVALSWWERNFTSFLPGTVD